VRPVAKAFWLSIAKKTACDRSIRPVYSLKNLYWDSQLAIGLSFKREAEAIRSRSKRRSSHKEGAPSGSGSPGTSNRPFVVFEASPLCTRSRERRVRRPPRSPTARVPGDAIIDTLTASRERRPRRPRRRARDGTATPFPMGP
jgi:hypothetical protein